MQLHPIARTLLIVFRQASCLTWLLAVAVVGGPRTTGTEMLVGTGHGTFILVLNVSVLIYYFGVPCVLFAVFVCLKKPMLYLMEVGVR